MKEMIIPKYRLEELDRELLKLNKIAAKNKLKPIIYAVIEEGIKKNYVYNQKTVYGEYLSKDIDVECVKIRIVGSSPKVEGYTFVSYIEIVGEDFQFFPYKDNLEKPNIEDLSCEHCHVKRKRKYYYQLEKDGEIITVGKSCLKDFLGHINIENLLMKLNFLFEDFSEKGMFKSIGYVNYNEYLYDVTVACNYLGKESALKNDIFFYTSLLDQSESDMRYEDKIKKEEYKKYCKKYKKELNEEFEKVKEYFSSPKANNFENNIYLEMKKDMVSPRKAKYGLIRYAPISYYKMKIRIKEEEKQKEAAKKSSFVGEIKEKRNMNLRYDYTRSYSTQYGSSYFHYFKDEKENVLIWSSMKSMNDLVGDVVDQEESFDLSFTVKSHKEYNGLKQTYITRVKYKS